MTRDQAARTVAAVRLLWPHSNLGADPAEVISMWHSLLEAFDHQAVDAAIRELAAEGREHAPPVGVVVKTVADRAADVPDWDEVRVEILHAIRAYRPPLGVQVSGPGGPYAPPPADYWSHPAIAQFIDGAWNEWRMSSPSDGTFAAQQREAWKARAERARRGLALAAIGAPRRRDLARPDDMNALPRSAA